MTDKDLNLNIHFSSNLNIAAATTTTDDDNDDFDGIKDNCSTSIPINGEILLLPLFSPVQADEIDNAKQEELEEDDDFDTGMIHVLTCILEVPLNHAIAQALWNDTVLNILSSNITAMMI